MKTIQYLFLLLICLSYQACNQCDEVILEPCGGSSDRPMVDLIVQYPGAEPEQVASLAVQPLERIMYEIQGVDHVYSASQRGMGIVTVQFDVGEDMEPSLVKLDAQTGQLLAQQALEPALRWLSIRHIAVSVAGDVVFGMQNQGPPDPELPVAGIWRATGGLELLHHTSSLRQGYIGSVALDRSGTIAATSAPRDDKILFWRMRDGHMLTTVTLADGCGIAAAEQARSFWLSSGDGVLHKVSLERDVLQLTQSVTLPLQWDNHMATL